MMAATRGRVTDGLFRERGAKKKKEEEEEEEEEEERKHVVMPHMWVEPYAVMRSRYACRLYSRLRDLCLCACDVCMCTGAHEVWICM